MHNNIDLNFFLCGIWKIFCTTFLVEEFNNGLQPKVPYKFVHGATEKCLEGWRVHTESLENVVACF